MIPNTKELVKKTEYKRKAIKIENNIGGVTN